MNAPVGALPPLVDRQTFREHPERICRDFSTEERAANGQKGGKVGGARTGVSRRAAAHRVLAEKVLLTVGRYLPRPLPPHERVQFERIIRCAALLAARRAYQRGRDAGRQEVRRRDGSRDKAPVLRASA